VYFQTKFANCFLHHVTAGICGIALAADEVAAHTNPVICVPFTFDKITHSNMSRPFYSDQICYSLVK